MMDPVDEFAQIRARMERVAAWADRYDGEIAGTIRDALNLNEPHWSDNDDRATEEATDDTT